MRHFKSEMVAMCSVASSILLGSEIWEVTGVVERCRCGGIKVELNVEEDGKGNQ